MQNCRQILIIFVSLLLKSIILNAGDGLSIRFDFYGQEVRFTAPQDFSKPLPLPVSESTLQDFNKILQQSDYQSCVDALLKYKNEQKPDDWLYYQLVRKTASLLSPKAENYYRYTIFKWFLMIKSGYDSKLFLSDDKLLFYVQCDENIYNIPYRIENGKQFVCLNFHDYKGLMIGERKFSEVHLETPGVNHGFTYKISRLPEFSSSDYVEKEIGFTYYQLEYQFKIKLNTQVRNIFANYPTVDYSSYFNIPLSRETYQSLIPALKKEVQAMNIKNGVDYLMRFTRYAFMFETDLRNFGAEKRLTPEQTLLSEKSDCEDRVALFFYLVKEIYDLPMIVLSYPKHLTIAVRLEKPVGHTISYNGIKYSVCEPTPQREDLPIGHLLPELRRETYEIVYAYQPANNKP